MYLLRIQVNQIVKILVERGLNINELDHQNGHDDYSVSHKPTGCYATIRSITSTKDVQFAANYSPDLSSPNIPKKSAGIALANWTEVLEFFGRWASWAKEEIEAPDLWAEATKTAQLFAPTATPANDKFTRTELAEVQGQLRLLQQSFTASALPEAAKQKLIELTHTAAEKAEGFTKKDWQGWFIGSLISAITALALNPTQANDVYKLVKAVFGGLFLH